MRVFLCFGFQVLILSLLLLPSSVLCGFSASLSLERAFPLNKRVHLSEIRARDRARHRRFLQNSNGVVGFPVFGSADRYKFGLYFTKVKLGSPPREFNLQIDTGSDITWISCKACTGCPNSSELEVPLQFYDPDSSSSASPISCSNKICDLAIHGMEGGCDTQNSLCSFSVLYADRSETSGYYVMDILHFDTFVGGSSTENSSTPVIFGCSNYQSGDMTNSDAAVDGIFGFGQYGMSIIAQLSAQRVIPRVFSHCLRGDENGGRVLVLGEILEPGIVYTPLVPTRYHYNLNLQSIAINGEILPIEPTVFATSSRRGTIIDSGTTLAVLAEEAYDPFVSYLIDAVSQSPNAASVASEADHCFQLSGSVDDVFPPVTLNFEGDASLVLRPKDYLLWLSFVDGMNTWCIGFQKYKGQGMTILGDLVLKDKIIVYDLARQQIGWVDYDCSSSVNVSTTYGMDSKDNKDESPNTGQLRVSSASRDILFKLTPIIITSCFLL